MNKPIRTIDQLKAVLRRARQAQNLSQAQFGNRLGLSQMRISTIELHPERMSVDQLLTVLTQLGQDLIIQPRSTTPPAREDW